MNLSFLYFTGLFVPSSPVVRLLALKSEMDIDFLENTINRQNILVESTGVPQLTVPQLGKYEVNVPIKDEQVSIGSFFSTLDTLITLQQSKSISRKLILKTLFTIGISKKHEKLFNI